MASTRGVAHAAPALPFFLGLALSGCLIGGGDGGVPGVKLKAEMLRVDLERPSGKRAAPAAAHPALAGVPAYTALPAGSAAEGPAWSSGLSITSFQIPVRRISLHNASFTRAADIHVCSGPGDGCRVEAAGTAFQDELDAAPVTVARGVYEYVFVKTCEDPEEEYASAITATVSLGGRTWHTHPTAVLDETGPARPLFVRSRNCGRTYALPRPLRITDSLGAQVAFKLYFDIEELAYAALGSRLTAGAWNPDHCAGDRPADTDAPGSPYLCIGYPELSGVADPAHVTLERYRINAGATLGLFFTGGSDLPAGGYTRRFFREGSDSDPGFRAVMPLRELSRNADGSLSLAAFGGGTRGEAGSEFKVGSFLRASHAGSFTGMPDSAGTPAPGSYSAERLAP